MTQRGGDPNKIDWLYGLLFLLGWVLLAIGISIVIGHIYGIRWY